jgi:hypothetical protein
VPRFAENAAALANEQSATIQIPVGAPRQILSVHKDALVRQPEEVMVFIVIDGTAQPRTIIIGEAVGARYEVLDGLSEGDLVIVRGNERLQPGMPVRIEEAS